MLFSSKLLALFALVSTACALPTSIPVLDSIPVNAVNIAKDPELDVVIAYDADGNVLGQLPASVGMRKRDAGSCVNMSSDDVQKLPGWEKIAQYARENWGDNWDSANANPDQYPDRGAILCVAGDVTPVTLDGEPSCKTQSQSTGGTIVGADGTVSLSANQGTSQTTQVTVTQGSSLAVGASVSAKVGIPEVAEITASMSSTVTFTNDLSTSNSFTSSNQQTQTVSLQNQAGKSCSLTFDVQTCDLTGTGNVRMLGSGWMWFFYGSRKNGHYHWAASIDSILSEDERQTSIGFRTSTSTNTASKYNAVCE
ncbi:hypothetical protein BKA62DRAFT_658916 [Auriculariales sp. MPI-PUGE-AT-0066]|nr:hypothetical protein BKA62DRAFT_658916 [Auriculariales sp. MPI-PUGE-AT-0066]